jgi:hypothetical protein
VRRGIEEQAMAAEWFYTTNKQKMGPVSWQELHELAEAGILKPSDTVWTEGMDKWVKAINQKGLFGEGGSEAFQDEAAGKKAAYTQSKPPPARRGPANKEDDDDIEDSKSAKKAARKAEEDRTKMAMGLKMGLILGGVLLLLLIGLGCVGGMVYVAVFGLGGSTSSTKAGDQKAGGDNKGGGDQKGGELRPFTHNNLPQNKFWDERRTFTKGKRITITVINTLDNPKTDVDLWVLRGTNAAPNERPIIADERRPSDDPNCKVDFTVPETDVYRVRIINRGPGAAKSCAVTFEER